MRVGPYRFFFYAGDRDEPEHVHVEREDRVAKFWLDPVRLARSGELSRVLRMVKEHQTLLMEAWRGYFQG